VKLIIAGTRDLPDAKRHLWDAIRRVELELGQPVTEEICGEGGAVDLAGKAWATWRGIPVRSFPADWSHGRRAGPLRNAAMAAHAGQGGALLLIWDGRSPGSRSMLTEAQRVGLRVFEVVVPRK
jgi:hypothetical protein